MGWLDRDESEVRPRVESDARVDPIAICDTRHEGVFSNFEELEYLNAVRAVVDYIKAGDVFQVNLAQRLLCRETCDPVSLYLRMRQRNPAPFAGYFDLGSQQLVSASPERFLRVNDRRVEARPIKGTRQRSPMPEAELFGR